MSFIAPGTGYTNLQDYLRLNQGTAQQMGQRAVAGVQQAGQASQAQLGTFQDQFQKMLASAQGQPAAPASPGTAAGGSAPATASPQPGGAGGGGRAGPGGKFKGGAPISMNLRAPGSGPPAHAPLQREADLYSAYANTDLSKLTADSLSGMTGWADALSGAQQVGNQAGQLAGGERGLSTLLGQQAGPGYYGGRGRALDAYATANSGIDFGAAASPWKGIADAYGMADVASAGAVDKLKAGRAAWEAQQASQPAGAAPGTGSPAGAPPQAARTPPGARAADRPELPGPVYSRGGGGYGGGLAGRRRIA